MVIEATALYGGSLSLSLGTNAWGLLAGIMSLCDHFCILNNHWSGVEGTQDVHERVCIGQMMPTCAYPNEVCASSTMHTVNIGLHHVCRLSLSGDTDYHMKHQQAVHSMQCKLA